MAADFPNIVAWAEDLTGVLYASDEARYDRHSAAVVAQLLLMYPCIGADYEDLTGDELIAFDEAAGYLLAARLLGITGFSGTGDSIVSKVKQRDVEVTYAVSASATSSSDDYITLGWTALKRIRCVTQTPIDTPSGIAVVVAARR